MHDYMAVLVQDGEDQIAFGVTKAEWEGDTNTTQGLVFAHYKKLGLVLNTMPYTEFEKRDYKF